MNISRNSRSRLYLRLYDTELYSSHRNDSFNEVNLVDFLIASDQDDFEFQRFRFLDIEIKFNSIRILFKPITVIHVCIPILTTYHASSFDKRYITRSHVTSYFFYTHYTYYTNSTYVNAARYLPKTSLRRFTLISLDSHRGINQAMYLISATRLSGIAVVLSRRLRRRRAIISCSVYQGYWIFLPWMTETSFIGLASVAAFIART